MVGQTPATEPDEINAAPTKTFFVDMLIRDIPLAQAVLDLVDNSIDGAKRSNPNKLDKFEIRIVLSHQQFRIWDNCGGFNKDTARDYAFRFGRPAGAPASPNSIGQFGVGMKRALFKFGRKFSVRSATKDEEWAIDVDVAKWEADANNWHFQWAEFGDDAEISTDSPGTDITVDKLRPEVAAQFGSDMFFNSISGLIKSKHRQFIAAGLKISVNGIHLDATNLYVLESNKLKPGVDVLKFGSGSKLLTVRIVAGVGPSSPKEAGWYVICNGRIILEADRRPEMGWGLLEEESETILIPKYHNQFARFRGIVSFDARDSSLLPWNTTKTDVDLDRPVWQATFQRMIEMMRPVINFLNELDADIDEYTKEASPMQDIVVKAALARAETYTQKVSFKAPKKDSLPKKKAPIEDRIAYMRSKKDINLLAEALDVTGAKAVGEKTFDLILARHKK